MSNLEESDEKNIIIIGNPGNEQSSSEKLLSQFSAVPPGNLLKKENEEEEKKVSTMSLSRLTNVPIPEQVSSSSSSSTEKKEVVRLNRTKSFDVSTNKSQNSTQKKPAKFKFRDHILIDSIESIYSKQIRTSRALIYQNFLCLFIILVCSNYIWILNFMNADKRERNYCFSSSLSQFDVCSPLQVCDSYEKKFNLLIYDNSKEYDNDYLSEISMINKKYKLFFVEQTKFASTQKSYNKYQIDINNEPLNCAVVVTAKEQWSMNLRYYSICSKPNIYLMSIILFILGGIVGSFFLSFYADVVGRKKMMVIASIILLISLGGFIVLFIYLELKEKSIKKEFDNTYNKNFQYKEMLRMMYVQDLISEKYRKLLFIFLFLIFIGALAAYPLMLISISLLVENSLNDSSVLGNIAKLFFVKQGISPFLSFCLCPLLNSLLWTFGIFFVIMLVLVFLVIFTLDESMRILFEYCEWEQLSKIAIELLDDLKENDFCNDLDLNLQKQEEFDYIQQTKNKNFLRKRQSLYVMLKSRISELNKLIRRNSEFIIKREEIIQYPFIILTCLHSNRIIQNTKTILIQVSLLIFLVSNLINRECMSLSFFHESMLKISRKQNFIINTPFFYMLIIMFIGNFLFSGLYRITNFKNVMIFSLMVISFLAILYHFLTAEIVNDPIDLNKYNTGMSEIFQEENDSRKLYGFVIVMKVLSSGVLLLLHVLILKYSRTLYRCTLLGVFNIADLASFALSEGIKVEMNHTMLFVGVMNFLGIITILFVNEAVDESYIVNDIKKRLVKRGRRVGYEDIRE